MEASCFGDSGVCQAFNSRRAADAAKTDDQHGIVTLYVEAVDSSAASVTVAIVLEVLSVNDLPSVSSPMFLVEGASISGDLVTEETDVEGDVEVVEPPSLIHRTLHSF